MQINKWLSSYPKLVIFSFLCLIALSTFSLLLPFCTISHNISLIDALFTATSAACVTGLTVVDTGSYFSKPGQVVILLTIQVGGLGIITLANLILVFSGKSVPFRSKVGMYETFGFLRGMSPIDLVKKVAVITFLLEAAGAILLLPVFYARFYSLSDALYYAIFHSISAFCNAGFSLFSNSLIDYRTNIILNFTICSLIFLGGIGFTVILDVVKKPSLSKRKTLSLHSKISLITSISLILFGTCFFIFTEYSKAYQGKSIQEIILVSIFQSVTARTAGFNTIDLNILSNQSLLLIILLMFIGASPGSTGGGIKTSTLFVLAAYGLSRVKGHLKPQDLEGLSEKKRFKRQPDFS